MKFFTYLTFYYRVKAYLENTSWIISEKILNMGISFFVAILVARYLGPEHFGILAYAISLVSLFAVSGHIGLSGLVVRELVKYPEAKKEILGTSFVLKGLGYLIGLFLLLTFIFIAEDVNSNEFWILIILSITLLFKPFDVIDFWFQSRLEAKYAAISNTLALLTSSALKIGLVLLGAHLILFPVANLVQSITVALLLVFLLKYKSNTSLKTWRFSRMRAKSLLAEGWMVFLGSIFAVIYLKIDQVMLKWFTDAEEVGTYAVAATLSEAWYFIPTAVVASFFPKLIKLKDSNTVLYHKRLQQLFDLLFLLALGVAIVITLIAQPLIITLFGEVYQQSASILVIHIWAALFIFMRAAFSKWILIEHALIFSLITQGFGALVNVALNYYLIPLYGGIGAAYGTLVSYAVASYFTLSLHPKTRIVFWIMTKSLFSPLRHTVLKLMK